MEQMLTRALLRVACLLLIVLTAYAVPSRAQDPNAPERAALVTLLGEDTLAVERWEHNKVARFIGASLCGSKRSGKSRR